MQGLMQNVPLTLDRTFNRAESLWRGKRIVTATDDGITTTTYGAWAERTRRLGGALDQLGISTGGRVGTMGWNTVRHLELYFATPCTARVLHTLNVRLSPRELTYMVNHAEDEALFVDRCLLPLLLTVLDDCKTVEFIVVMPDGSKGSQNECPLPSGSRFIDYEELITGAVPHSFGMVWDEDQAAAICYTSGTTGSPKGVVYSHRSMVLHSMATALPDAFGISETDVVMPVVPMFHVNAWSLCHTAAMVGSDLVLPGRHLAPGRVADLILAEGVTVAAGVPTIWIDVLPFLAGKSHKLREIISGGSAVPMALSEAYRSEVGIPILQGWGMTETSSCATISRVRNLELDAQDDCRLIELRATQGRPLPLVELRIIEVSTGKVLPWDGEATGEVQVRGPAIAASYFRDGQSDITQTAGDWLSTGDIATITPDCYIKILDRSKDMIKSGGEWISSVEIENNLMAHPAVEEAAVIAVASERWIERPMACVVLKTGQTMREEEILEWLAPRVPKWWLPSVVEFLDEIPKTSVGKFSKKSLRERFASRSVD